LRISAFLEEKKGEEGGRRGRREVQKTEGREKEVQKSGSPEVQSLQ
jgi:hypothetical protein